MNSNCCETENICRKHATSDVSVANLSNNSHFRMPKYMVGTI